jgi:hypothetical protein
VNRSTKTLLGIAVAVIGLLLPYGAQAQWVLLGSEADAMVKRGLDATYNLRYDEADSIFNQLTVKFPNHPAGYFLLALVDWWRIVPNVDVDSKVDRYSESFDERINRTVEICDQLLEKNPSDIVGLFFKASALGYHARLTVTRYFSDNFGVTSLFHLVPAIKEGHEAYNILLECQRLAPSNSDVLLGSGIFNYMAAYIPATYPSLKPMLGFLPPGDRKIGIQMLRVSGNRAQYAATEAQYSLMEVLNIGEKDYTGALQIAQALHAKYPANPVFLKYLAKSYYMTSDFINADSSWNEILRRVKRRDSGYELTLARQGLYYLGDIRMRNGRYDDAVKLFNEAIEVSKRIESDDESSWIVQANLKLGNAYDKMQRRSDAVRQYRKVLSMDEYSGSRDKAKLFLEKPYQ